MKSLNNVSEKYIEDYVLSYAQSIINEMDFKKDEVVLLGAKVYGSRSRENLYNENSDLDVVLSYKGNIREDYFFNLLHETDLRISNMKLDINPISEDRITLEEYMIDAEKYLDEKRGN